MRSVGMSSSAGSVRLIRQPSSFTQVRATPRLVVVGSQKPECGEKAVESSKLQGAAAAALAATVLLTTAIAPGEALAARSGGRVGGSSFRSSAPRSAPRAAAPRAGPTVRNYNSYNMSPSPPLIGGYGYGGYGYGGYGGGLSLFPTFVSPIGGGFFQLVIIAFIASTVLGTIRSLVSKRRDDDNWD